MYDPTSLYPGFEVITEDEWTKTNTYSTWSQNAVLASTFLMRRGMSKIVLCTTLMTWGT